MDSQCHWLSNVSRQLYERQEVQSLLLFGSPHIGKCQLVIGYARYLLCQSKQDSQSCGACMSCKWFISGNHPDFLHLVPNKNTIITLDVIEQIEDFSQISAHIYSGYKIIVIEAAEAMNTNAANALLKTLEESNCIFLLISHRIDGVIATIRSRCQLIQCMAPTKQQSQVWLETQGLDKAFIKQWVALFPNQPLLALQAAQEKNDSFKTLKNEIDDLCSGAANVIAIADKWSKLDLAWGYNIMWWMVYEILQLRFKHISLAELNYLPDKVEVGLQQIDSVKLFAFLDQLHGQIAALHSGYNLNAKLALTDLLFGFEQLLKQK